LPSLMINPKTCRVAVGPGGLNHKLVVVLLLLLAIMVLTFGAMLPLGVSSGCSGGPGSMSSRACPASCWARWQFLFDRLSQSGLLY
jgi:hypothetical protein